VPAAEQASPVSSTETARLFADLANSPGLVLAVSGGPDSTALLMLGARWRESLPRGPKLTAVTIDHGLRAESAEEAEAVKRLAGALGVPHRILHWSGAKPATGLQEAAREARYRLLAAAAHEVGAPHILTAHTADDQAETVLMRMARGSGLTGLAGMARVTPLSSGGAKKIKLVRPFLDIPKARLIATLAAAGVGFAEDPSNQDPRFTRVRMRGLTPALAREGLTARRIALLARRAARAEAALEAAVDEAQGPLLLESSPDRRVAFDVAAFAALPAEIALRVLGRAIARFGTEGRLELGKLETLFTALAEALQKAPPPRFRRTLAGASVTHDAGRLVVERAPARRHGVGHESALGKMPSIKEIQPVPLAEAPGGPTLAVGRSRSLQIARTTLAAGPPARHKGRQ
jgi:tRNA(Ile)-lysidine synthase